MKTNLFGKPSNEIGSLFTDAVIKTAGSVKVRFGSKHVTIFKDGKLVTDNDKLIHTASLIGKKEGFWVIYPKTEEQSDNANLQDSNFDPQQTSVFLRTKGVDLELITPFSGYTIPSKTIVAYYGDVIPKGWVLCDGKNYDVSGNEIKEGDTTEIYLSTPNLTNKFISGLGSTLNTYNLILLQQTLDKSLINVEYIKYIIKL